MERLIELADKCNFYFPTAVERVAEEVGLLMPGVGHPDPMPATPLDMTGPQLIIQHADTVNVYTTGALDPLQDVPHNGR